MNFKRCVSNYLMNHMIIFRYFPRLSVTVMKLKKLLEVPASGNLSDWPKRRKLVDYTIEESQWNCGAPTSPDSSHLKLSKIVITAKKQKRNPSNHQRSQRRWKRVSWLAFHGQKCKKYLVRNFLDWTRAERARHPIGIPLKTVVVNRKATPYQDITSFDSDLVMRHVKICDHYNYNCNVCNVARRRQEIGKTNRLILLNDF